MTRVRPPHGYTVTLSFTPPRTLEAEWDPGLPRISSPRARRKFYAAYTAERDRFLADVAAMTGHGIAVIDHHGDGPARLTVIGAATKH